MTWIRRSVVAAAVIVAVSATAWSEAPPKDEAARRAAIAKLGRLAWSDVGKPLAFCDLDGGNVVTTDAPPAQFVKWLPDGKRAFAAAGGSLFVVEAATGKATDIAPDRGRQESFASPRVSPDGRRALARHLDRAQHVGYQCVGYAVFDLDSGKRWEIKPTVKEDWVGGAPPAWWAPDGTIVAVLGEEQDTLVRFDPDGNRLEEIAKDPAQIRHVAFQDKQVVFTVESESGQYVHVRAAGGKVLLRESSHVKPITLAFDSNGVLQLWTINYDTRVERGLWLAGSFQGVLDRRPPIKTCSTDRTTCVETRSKSESTKLVAVNSATGEEVEIGPGTSPQAIGSVFVFWRVTVPNKTQEGPYFEQPKTIQGTDDLWAYDPKDGAVTRLTDRGFTARCWDILVSPQKK